MAPTMVLANVKRRALIRHMHGARLYSMQEQNDSDPLAMLHVGRCGSTVVARMLDDHPEVTWDGEIFEPSVRAHLPEPVDLEPAALIAARRERAHGRYGFETKYLQSHHLGRLGLSLEGYLATLEGLGFRRFVTLHRRNYLRRVVSGAVGRSSGTWHRSRAGAGPLVEIRLDPQRVPFGPDRPLLDVFHELEAGEAALREQLPKESTLRLTYEEDIASDPTIAYRRICSLMDIEPLHPRPELFPTNPFPLHQILTNYEEIATLLDGTRFEWMLEA